VIKVRRHNVSAYGCAARSKGGGVHNFGCISKLGKRTEKHTDLITKEARIGGVGVYVTLESSYAVVE
jgi:hypothetical protein